MNFLTLSCAVSVAFSLAADAGVVTKKDSEHRRGLNGLDYGGVLGGQGEGFGGGGHLLGSYIGGYGVYEEGINLGNGYGSEYGGIGGAIGYAGHGRKVVTITKVIPYPVPHPVPYKVVQKVPVPQPIPLPYPVAKPYPVQIPKPYAVHVDRPYPVILEKPYPVKIPHTIPVHIPKHVAYPIHIPLKAPYADHKPVSGIFYGHEGGGLNGRFGSVGYGEAYGANGYVGGYNG